MQVYTVLDAIEQMELVPRNSSHLLNTVNCRCLALSSESSFPFYRFVAFLGNLKLQNV